MDDATLTSSDSAAMDRLILVLLLVLLMMMIVMLMLIHSLLLRKEGSINDAVSKELLAVTQRLLDTHLRLSDGGEEGQVMVSSSDSASDHHLMDGAAVAKKKERAAAAAAAAEKKAVAAAKKKKRNKRNKAAAKHKGKKRMSWLVGGIISLLMMAAFEFDSITSLSLIPQSDGSSEGNKAPPTLPPSASTSLRQRDLQSSNNMASVSPYSSVSPLAVVVQAPIFSPADVSNRRINSVDVGERTLSTCFDTRNWEDIEGDDCKWYEEEDEPGCPEYGSLFEGSMGVANDNCCYCGGGTQTLSPTTSPKPSSSPTRSVTPSSSPKPSSSPTITASPTELCVDTPNWEDKYGEGCEAYEVEDEPGCPYYGSLWGGNMGVANDNCCYCGGGSHTLPPTTSPKPSSSPTKSVTPSSSPTTSNSPTKSATPTASQKPSISPTKSATPSSSPSSGPSMCTDTEGWYDEWGYDCSWYEVMDVPGCPQYGSRAAHFSSTAEGSAKDNCCYCQNAVVSSVSPTKAPSSSGTCVDTAGWENIYRQGCEWYQYWDDPGCPEYGNINVWDMGPVAENCCYCKDPTCEDYKRKCQKLTQYDFWALGVGSQDRVKRLCDEAASCSCEAADHDVKIVTNLGLDEPSFNETVGLYNECKCDFWSHLCEDARQGDACDYAAEYCCGDYRYDNKESLSYLNGLLCYCDFVKYAQNEFGHTLKPKALNTNKEFSNTCGGHFERIWVSELQLGLALEISRVVFERQSLEAIYNATNGQKWTNNEGWMSKKVDHCLWYGISCNDDGFVTSIDLIDNNLVGQFPVYTRNAVEFPWGFPTHDKLWFLGKYGLANLYNLKTIDLSNNKLTGTIEYLPLYNLNALIHFDVSGNQLSGEVEALVARSLTYADFSNNRFTSMRRFQKYKVSPLQTLRYCDVSNNAIQEDANDILENIPPNIEQLVASKNKIYGSLPESLNNLQNLRLFNMASNALSGKLPGFTESFATLQELDVSNQTNGFTGSIPEDIWRSLSLNILNLASNRLTGTIPSLAGNLAVLEVFDLSDNRLNSSLPSELGMLEGSLKRLDLSKNALTGIIPSQIGQLQGASIVLKDNHFHNSSTAPLSLCMEREVEAFDLENDTTLCPPERNALSDFYDSSSKGAEWTNGSLWLHEYASYCDWKGVDCDNNRKHVTKLQLSNNGLSGRLSESIGKLEYIEVLDLSDNEIKGSIPAEIGKLKNLTYLRLSYNAFTGAAPEGLGELTQLQLLQLQSNRITEMPTIPQLNKHMHFKESTFVTDCGVPSAFDEALKCENCTMCCNANDDCYPQEETQVAEWGLKDYGTFAALIFGCFIVFCCIVTLLLYEYDRRKNRGISLTLSMETRINEDDEYALSKIGQNSVYSYFVTDKVFGWLAAFATVGIQIGILVVFIIASEPKLQVDTIDIQFTWKCPRDTDECKDKSDLTKYGWAIFCLLMVAFLAKDVISGSKLIYHSAKVRHSLGSRIRYFFGGMCLCWITLFAFYVSTVYNKAIATSDTEIILNSVVVLFIMELDEWIFSDLEAINKKWTAHAADGSEDTSSDIEARSGSIIAEMKEEMTRQSEQIASQQEEMESKIEKVKEEMNKEIELQKAQIATQQEELRMLRELVEKVLQSQAAASTSTTTTASDSEKVSEYEGDTNSRQMEQVDEITMPSNADAEQNVQEPQAAASSKPDSECNGDTENLQE